MSIAIKKNKCIGCGKCFKVCPGNLIGRGKDLKAHIEKPKDCWGCTACIKECPIGAIDYYLGLDIGGNGGRLQVKEQGDVLEWHVLDQDKKRHIIKTNKKESNKY